MTDEALLIARRDEIPPWVPWYVKEIALILPVWKSRVNGDPIGRRLLLDPRMEPVWTYLRKRKIEEECLTKYADLEMPETWGIDALSILPIDRACAAFYVRTLLKLLEVPPPNKVPTQSDRVQYSDPWMKAASLCRWAKKYEQKPQADPSLANALEIVANYLDIEGQLRLGTNNEFSIVRSAKERNKDNLRVGARIVSTAAYDIFGEHLYGTSATVTSVAFNEKVSAALVRDQIEGVPTPPANNLPA